jgi:bifunctional enzyme CysN/CysC
MVDAGLITLAAFISPYRQERQAIRDLVGEGNFVEIFVNTPLEVCEDRDVKGLYAKARRGELKNFTGIDSEYQDPETPDIDLKTTEITAEQAAERVVQYLQERGYLHRDAE